MLVLVPLEHGEGLPFCYCSLRLVWVTVTGGKKRKIILQIHQLRISWYSEADQCNWVGQTASLWSLEI